jgi:hypothetical protein
MLSSERAEAALYRTGSDLYALRNLSLGGILEGAKQENG